MVKNHKAFTIIEVLIVIGVLTVLAFIALPLAIREIQTGKTDSFIRELNSSFRILSQDAFSGKNNKDYGIALLPDSYIIFIGPSLSEAEEQIVYPTADEVIIKNIDLTDSATEIVFTAFSQKPDVHGTFEVGDNYSTYLFDINKEGLITYHKL